jgi:hypothetical protein
MTTILAVKRLAFVALSCLVLAGCGPYNCMLTLACGDRPDHTDYFIVTFLPGTPAPSDAGVDALGHAVGQAGRRRPTAIAVTGTAPPDGPVPALVQQQADAIADAFTKAGIDARLIHTQIIPGPQTAYDERKDSFTVGLDYGNLPQP